MSRGFRTGGSYCLPEKTKRLALPEPQRPEVVHFQKLCQVQLRDWSNLLQNPGALPHKGCHLRQSFRSWLSSDLVGC